MAAIDKTYTDKWSDYQDLKKWAFGKIFTTPNGAKINMYYYLLNGWTKEDFDGNERPIMSTSYTADYYIIKYCPLKFVQDRMKEVYDKEYYDSVKNGTSYYDTFSKEGKYGTKVRIIKRPDKLFGNHNYALWVNKDINKRISTTWWVSIVTPEEYEFVNYDEEYNRWIWPEELGEGHSNICNRYYTIKALIKAIRKWQLPKGTIVKAGGRYIGDEYHFLVY